MSAEAWVLFVLLLGILATVTTQFGRLLLHIMKMHREERREANVANRSVIQSLEAAIRENGGVTNHFTSEVQQNQIGNENDQS